MIQKHIKINEQNYNRIIVMSDLHAHASLFKECLNKLTLTKKDLLIINGDIINKGPHSLALLQNIMSLSKEDNVIVLKGNHESYMYKVLMNNKYHQHFLKFLKSPPYPNIISEMVTNSKLKINMHSTTIKTHMHKKYKSEFDFIAQLPIVIETQNHIITHAGFEDDFDVNKSEDNFIKYDNFINTTTSKHKKTIIVGHYPASNMRDDINTNLPYFDRKKNVIAIDGGLGVKTNGELNAFIINPNHNQAKYKTVQHNHFKSVQIIKSIIFKDEPLTLVNYPYFELECVQKGKILSKMRHRQSNKTLSVFNCLLNKVHYHYEPKIVYNNRFFNLKVGDNVKLCSSFDDCHLVKYNDEFGWILREQL